MQTCFRTATNAIPTRERYLNRWKYDSIQRANIFQAIYSVEESPVWYKGFRRGLVQIRIYVSEIQIYTGARLNEEREVDLSGRVVRELMQHYHGVGYHLYTDNY